MEAVSAQKAEFRSWGILGDWEDPYLTLSPQYVKRQLGLFARLAEDGLVFRSYMPVYWSPAAKTAMAESELEYEPNHVSTAAYVRFKLDEKSANRFGIVVHM